MAAEGVVEAVGVGVFSNPPVLVRDAIGKIVWVCGVFGEQLSVPDCVIGSLDFSRVVRRDAWRAVVAPV